jgi:TM2 domain-containing membrane protein YozV
LTPTRKINQIGGELDNPALSPVPASAATALLCDTAGFSHLPAATMTVLHKNKTFATLLAFLTGGLGLHRFYLRGLADKWGWLHAASLLGCAAVFAAWPHADPYFLLLPLIVSILAGFLEALVLGLMADEKWDAAFNAGSAQRTDSRWPLAVILVTTLLFGAFGLIATIARLFDLLYTGGAYG